jgi:hypothetical protein
MKRYLLILVMSLTGLAPAQLPAAVQSPQGQVSELREGERTHSVQAATLAGLWALSLAVDLSWQGGEDLLSYYPAGALSAPPTRAYPGFGLGLRRHLNDSFFVGAHLGSLPKSHRAVLGADEDDWAFEGLMLGVSGGWLLYRAVSVAFYAEAQAAWLTLIDGQLQRRGPAATSGSLEGSALAEQFSLGALWFILPSVALEAQGGYRFARLPLGLVTKAGRQSPPSAPEFYADFSGSFARLGLSFFWGLKNPWGEQAPPGPPGIPPPAE